MWRLVSAAVPIALLVIAAGTGLPSRADTPAQSPEVSPSASASPSPSPSPEPTPALTPEPLPPAPEPTPFDPKSAEPQISVDPAYPGSLRPGDWVRITGTGSCLNLRWEPRIPAPLPDGTVYDNVLNCLPDGFVGRLDVSGWGNTIVPVSADGRWWWHIVGQGWAAEEWLTLHHQGGIPWPERPDLAGSGLIAYIGRDNGIWLMNADGRNARPILAGDPNQWVQMVQWSPQGDRLAFSLNRPDGTLVTRVIALNGNIQMELQGFSGARWSPQGGRLSGVRTTPGGVGGYQAATPVVFDTFTSAEWAIGPATHYYLPPAWSPDGNSLAFVCVSGYIGQPDGTTIIEEGRDCHGDGLRVVSVDGSNARVLVATGPQNGGYLSEPAWSPSGQTIAVTSMQQGDGCRGYTLVDVASGATTGCAPLPPVAAFIGGRCGGGSEMGASSWTPDGRLVLSAQGAGQSGVFVHNPATGTRTAIPNMNAGPASLSSGGENLTFAGAGYIWAAGLDGSNLTLLAEGHSPAWQPLP